MFLLKFSEISPRSFIIYKLLVTTYIFVWLVLSIFYNNFYQYGSNGNRTDSTIYHDNGDYKVKNYWFLYLPNLAYIVLLFYYVLNTSLLIYIYFHQLKIVQIKDLFKKKTVSTVTLRNMATSWSNESNDLNYSKNLVYILWITYTIIVPLTYAVTILFVVNEAMYSTSFDLNKNGLATWMTINVNVINSIIITIEFLFSLIPVRLYHFYFPLTYVFFYGLLTAMLYEIDSDLYTWDHHNLFEFMSEKSPFISFGLYCALVFSLHIAHFLLQSFKIWLFFDVFEKKIESDEIEFSIKSDTLSEKQKGSLSASASSPGQVVIGGKRASFFLKD